MTLISAWDHTNKDDVICQEAVASHNPEALECMAERKFCERAIRVERVMNGGLCSRNLGPASPRLLKGAAQTVGAADVGAVAAMLEEAGKSGDRRLHQVARQVAAGLVTSDCSLMVVSRRSPLLRSAFCSYELLIVEAMEVVCSGFPIQMIPKWVTATSWQNRGPV